MSSQKPHPTLSCKREGFATIFIVLFGSFPFAGEGWDEVFVIAVYLKSLPSLLQYLYSLHRSKNEVQ